MDALVGSLTEAVVTRDAPLDAEFERRLADCSTLAFRVAMGVLRHREDAEDVAQEAFVRAYRGFHRLRDRERFRAWLIRITWRLALDRLRSAKRRERYELLTEPPELPGTETVEDAAATCEFRRHLQRALDQLPEKLRLVVVLGAMEGYKTEEMARLLNLPEGTVKSRLHFARKQLAEKLRWVVRTTKTG
jgi:RNA polymerase sigma-70 factor (ECF subfamily)